MVKPYRDLKKAGKISWITPIMFNIRGWRSPPPGKLNFLLSQGKNPGERFRRISDRKPHPD